MDHEHLHLLINEEIYQIGNDSFESPDMAVQVPEKKPEIKQTSTVQESTKTPSDPKSVSARIDEVIPVAIFHETTEESELILLQKIIDACGLETTSYQVFANGFNKEVKFKKALVFVSSSKSYYEPIPYQKSHILCSRPLKEIQNNQQEKMKLWTALKNYL